MELTDERASHIADRYPDLWPAHRELVFLAVSDPETVHATGRAHAARIFARWFAEVAGGKSIAAVETVDEAAGRNWLVTAYISRKLVSGDIEWRRS